MPRPTCTGSGQPPQGDPSAFSGACSVCGYTFVVVKGKIHAHKAQTK
jgi:hypothetical protein